MWERTECPLYICSGLIAPLIDEFVCRLHRCVVTDQASFPGHAPPYLFPFFFCMPLLTTDCHKAAAHNTEYLDKEIINVDACKKKVFN